MSGPHIFNVLAIFNATAYRNGDFDLQLNHSTNLKCCPSLQTPASIRRYLRFPSFPAISGLRREYPTVSELGFMAAPAASKKVSPAAANSHYGIVSKLSVVVLVGALAWFYRSTRPPPPNICGSPNGPPITSSRIKLKDGRHLSYIEAGVSKEKARYKAIMIHCFDCSKHYFFPVSQEVVNEYSIYLLSFDRAGYGESDPDPKMSVKSIAEDVEELADKMELGPKFYVMGFSMGGAFAWGTLKYIPHRLAGAALVAPVSNYWWRSFPKNLSKEAYSKLLPQDQWAISVAHYAPWLTYWWNTQKWFPSFSMLAESRDKEPLPEMLARHEHLVRQQGDFYSLHRDMMVGFGSWEFDPLNLTNPFPNGEGSVHLWHGTQDLLVDISLTRYIAQKLPWIHYHEIPGVGHEFPFADEMSDAIVKVLVLGKL